MVIGEQAATEVEEKLFQLPSKVPMNRRWEALGKLEQPVRRVRGNLKGAHATNESND